MESCVVDTDTLRMFHARFHSLLGAFAQLDPSLPVAPHALQQVVAYCTFVGLFERGFVTLVEPPFRSQSGMVWCIIVRCRYGIIVYYHKQVWNDSLLS